MSNGLVSRAKQVLRPKQPQPSKAVPVVPAEWGSQAEPVQETPPEIRAGIDVLARLSRGEGRPAAPPATRIDVNPTR